MFERFTDQARRVIVLAQEEARALNHDYIGTEHILLGLIVDGTGIGGRALESLGVDLDRARREVEARVGRGEMSPAGHVPFTSRAKKVLELASREATQFGHHYIGTEHLLLGLLVEGKGVGAEVLTSFGADLASARRRVAGLLQDWVDPEVAGPAAAPFTASDSDVRSVRTQPYDAAAGPLCTMCRAPLVSNTRSAVIDIGGREEKLLVVFCAKCGDTVSTKILPEER